MGFVFTKLTSNGKLVFTKLRAGDTVVSNNGFSFKKLSTKPEPRTIEFDPRLLGLPVGTHIIAVTAIADGYAESDESLMTYMINN